MKATYQSQRVRSCHKVSLITTAETVLILVFRYGVDPQCWNMRQIT